MEAKKPDAGAGGAPAISEETIDYYARQSLAGDNSWQVGLARGKVGQNLIQKVKDRIPQLAATGAGFVSVGALTHSAPAIDISFELEPI